MKGVDRETAAQIEHIEAEAWRSLYESVSSSDRDDLGISTHEIVAEL